MRILLTNHDAAEEAALVAWIQASEPAWSIASSPSEADIVFLGAVGAVERRVERCRRIRDDGYLGPLIVGCAMSDAEALLEASADDYVVLPYAAADVITRLRARVRRVTTELRHRGWPLEIDRFRSVVRLHRTTIAVSKRECELLTCLIEARGRPLSKAQLCARVWRPERVRPRVVEVHVRRLREKLGDETIIETVRGMGYRLRP